MTHNVDERPALVAKGSGATRFIGTLITVAIAIIVVGGSAWLIHLNEPQPATKVAQAAGTMKTPQGDLPHYTLDLSVYPNANTADCAGGPTLGETIPGPVSGIGQVFAQKCPPFWWDSTSLELPAHSAITITVHQYDGSTPVNSDYFADVHGTIDGKASYNGEAKTGIKPADVAHTFTIHQYPQAGQPYFFVSVPMRAVPSNAKPESGSNYPKAEVIEFTFITGDPGSYIWNCEDPCGNAYQGFGGVMMQRGWMAGTVEVV